jgi:hypothetical protein
MEISRRNEVHEQFNAHGRKAVRFNIPGATVEVAGVASAHAVPNQSAERCPVLDLSRGGLAFLTNAPLRQSRISLALVYSDEEEPIALEGRIVYAVPRGAQLSYRFRVGVEFAPFSHHKGHNSLQALSRLEKLEALYVTHEDESLPGAGEF